MPFPIERPELVVHVCTGYQVALGVKVHPVGAAALISEQCYLSGFAVPTVNAVVGLVGKEHVTPCVSRRSFCKAIRIRNSHRGLPFCNDIT